MVQIDCTLSQQLIAELSSMMVCDGCCYNFLPSVFLSLSDNIKFEICIYLPCCKISNCISFNVLFMTNAINITKVSDASFNKRCGSLWLFTGEAQTTKFSPLF